MREFCDFRNLLPRGVKLAPEDVWDRVAFVLSLKMTDPQFSGQTKERLSSRQAAGFVEGAAHDAFFAVAEHARRCRREDRAARDRTRVGAAQRREAGRAQEGDAGPGPARQAGRLHFAGPLAHRAVPGRRRFGRRQRRQARDKDFQAILPLRGKILNTWEVASGQVLASQEVHDLAVAIGCDPAGRPRRPARYGKVIILADADSDGLHIATLLAALFLRHFPTLVAAGHVFVAMPPLFRVDVGKQVFYALDDEEKRLLLRRSRARSSKGAVNVTRFKGLGEMNPQQLRESTIHPDTAGWCS